MATSQGDCLAVAEPEGREDLEQQPVLSRNGGDDLIGDGRIEVLGLLVLDLRELDVVGGIAGDKAIVDGGVQDESQDDDRLTGTTGGEAFLEHRGDPLLNVGATELR